MNIAAVGVIACVCAMWSERAFLCRMPLTDTFLLIARTRFGIVAEAFPEFCCESFSAV